MKPVEIEKWETLLKDVDSLSPELLKKFREQEYFLLFGRRVQIGDHDRFCTREGLETQLSEFAGPCGLVYYISEKTRSFEKMAFTVKRDWTPVLIPMIKNLQPSLAFPYPGREET